MLTRNFTEEERRDSGSVTPVQGLEETNNALAAMTPEEAIKAVVLLAIYLQSWDEESTRNPGEFVLRAWKGYKFDILNELQAEGMIFQKKGMQSVLLNPKALKPAESLKTLFFSMLGVNHD